MGGQGTKRLRKIAENFSRRSRVHPVQNVTDDRQTTDGTAIAYSERELTFTFAKSTPECLFWIRYSFLDVNMTVQTQL